MYIMKKYPKIGIRPTGFVPLSTAARVVSAKALKTKL